MKPAQLLLEYQRLVERERALRDDIARIESRLESDPEVVRLAEALEIARSSQQAVTAQLRAFDHEREDHRTRLRSREKDLMSGRIRSPSELIQLSDEVQIAGYVLNLVRPVVFTFLRDCAMIAHLRLSEVIEMRVAAEQKSVAEMSLALHDIVQQNGDRLLWGLAG